MPPATSETRPIRQICSGENYILHIIWRGLLPCCLHLAQFLPEYTAPYTPHV
jgi:hypothetical protein